MKQKKMSVRLINERRDEIQNLSEQINYNNLAYYFKTKNKLKHFIGFRFPLNFFKNIRDGGTIIEEINKK